MERQLEKTNQRVVRMSDRPTNVRKIDSGVFDFDNIEKLLEVCASIAKSGFSPIKTKEGVMTAILAGRELGLTPMSSLTNIYPINDRPTLGIRILLGICLKNSITYEIIDDYKPEYSYKLESGETITQSELEKNRSNYFVLITNSPPSKGYLATYKEGQIRAMRAVDPCDRVTTTEFTRHFSLPNGEIKIIKQRFSFRWSEAKERGYLEKDNWIKMLKTMMRTRCLSGNAYLIAPDFLSNISETSEIADSYSDYKVVVEEDGEVTTLIEPITPNNTVVETVENATDK